MPGEATVCLRIVNGDLRAGLARLQPEPNAPWIPKPEDLSDLLEAVSRAAKCRRSVAPDAVPDPELEQELREYRSNMEDLAKVLPSFHGRLLAEKARIQNTQSRLAAANAWAKASKDTL